MEQAGPLSGLLVADFSRVLAGPYATMLLADLGAEWFPELIAAGVPCGPINTVAGGVGFAAEVGLEPVQLAGQGGAAVPTVRHPLSFSRTPPRYDLPPT